MMTPSVGRIVHVFNRNFAELDYIGIGPYPAIIVNVVSQAEMEIDVDVFPQKRGGLVTGVPYSDKEGNRGREVWWAWPERV